MSAISLRERTKIVVLGYVVVVIFAAVFEGLGFLSPNALGTAKEGLTTTERLILAAVSVVPLVMGLLWDRLKSIKFGEMEILLSEVTATINVELATAIQTMDGSATPQLVAFVSLAITQADLRLLEINLRTQPYWWSTRLFLLAALAEKYTNIERLVIVRDDNERVFVGLVTPTAVRRKLGSRFPDLERVFTQLVSNVQALGNPTQEVQGIGSQWSYQSFAQQQHTPEISFRQLVSQDLLGEWLGTDLEIVSYQWSGALNDKQLYGNILRSSQPYVPLLHGRSLVKVVNRREFAERLAIQAVS